MGKSTISITIFNSYVKLPEVSVFPFYEILLGCLFHIFLQKRWFLPSNTEVSCKCLPNKSSRSFTSAGPQRVSSDIAKKHGICAGFYDIRIYIYIYIYTIYNMNTKNIYIYIYIYIYMYDIYIYMIYIYI